MTPRTLTEDDSTPDIRSEIGTPARRLRANVLTQALASRFDDLLKAWTTIHQQELDLEDAVDDATMEVVSVDAELNGFAQRVSSEVLTYTGKDRTDALYVHLFGDKPVSRFIQPILSDKLEKMHTWVSPLQSSEHGPLAALGAELPGLLKIADETAQALVDAEQAKREFRAVGERKKFIDEVNAARKETYGVLATMPHKHPGLSLRFADGFFPRKRKKTSEPTEASVKATIESLKQDILEQEQLLVKIEKQQAEAKAAAEEKARQDAKAKLAEIEKVIEQNQKEAAALKATLGG